jgi:hypothetical protein
MAAGCALCTHGVLTLLNDGLKRAAIGIGGVHRDMIRPKVCHGRKKTLSQKASSDTVIFAGFSPVDRGTRDATIVDGYVAHFLKNKGLLWPPAPHRHHDCVGKIVGRPLRKRQSAKRVARFVSCSAQSAGIMGRCHSCLPLVRFGVLQCASFAAPQRPCRFWPSCSALRVPRRAAASRQRTTHR